MGFIRDGITGQVYQVNPGLGYFSTGVALLLINGILVGLAWFLSQVLEVTWGQVTLVAVGVLVPFNALFLYYTRRNMQIRRLVDLLKDPNQAEAAEEALIDNFPNEQISRSIKQRNGEINQVRMGLSRIDEGFDDFSVIQDKIKNEEKGSRFKFLGKKFLQASDYLRNSVTPEVQLYMAGEFEKIENRAYSYVKEGERLDQERERVARARSRAENRREYIPRK